MKKERWLRVVVLKYSKSEIVIVKSSSEMLSMKRKLSDLRESFHAKTMASYGISMTKTMRLSLPQLQIYIYRTVYS